MEHQQVQGASELLLIIDQRISANIDCRCSCGPQSARQALSEKLGRGSRTVDLDLESRLELLRDDRQRYENVTKLAQMLASQLAQFTITQKTLGDAFSELSLKTPMLHVSVTTANDANATYHLYQL